MEEKIIFLSDGHEIEALIDKNNSSKGVVITHPHPLYGGDMHNDVVVTICQAYQKKDYTTLRFNFRGVGSSQGSYSDGVGEQQDVRTAISYLKDMGTTHIELAGYSFGAWVNAMTFNKTSQLASMIMVSPPVAFIDFKEISNLECLTLIATGSRDEIAPPHQIDQLKTKWNPQALFEIIEGADHFYWGYLDQLESVLVSNI